jgi:2-polyprenyl-3-methyl-5-hydroxy-6-metoxy-1,4-benzoquinol methylase
MSTAAAPRPSPEKIFEALTRYQQTYALKAGIELELFTAIGEGANEPASLAGRVKSAERGVRILADYLTIQGFMTKENGKYALTPDAAVFLDKRSPAYMGAMAEFLVSDQNLSSCQILAQSVRKGGTATKIGDNSKPEDERWVNFARSMSAMAVPMAGVLARMIAPSSAPVRILDIAAGHGMYGITVAKNLSNVQVTALDWPAVLEVAKENAAKAGVLDRFSTRAGSAFDADLGEGYDYIFITNFLHHFDPPTNEKLLRRFHAALKPGGKALTVEFVPNPDRVTPPMAAAFSLVMLAHTDAGDAYTFAEYEKMFRAAGFTSCSLQLVPELPQQVVVAEK